MTQMWASSVRLHTEQSWSTTGVWLDVATEKKELGNNVLIRGRFNSLNPKSTFSFLLTHRIPWNSWAAHLKLGEEINRFIVVGLILSLFWFLSFLTSCLLHSPEPATEWCCSWCYQINRDTWTWVFLNLFQRITSMWNSTSLSMASSCVCRWSRTWKWKISPQ